MSFGPGKHILRYDQAGSTVDLVPTSSGNVWLDVNCMRKNLNYTVRYPSSAPAGRIVVMDAGPFGKFSDTGTRGITLKHGQSITFKRTGRETYDVVSVGGVSGLQGRSSSFNTAPVRILIVGQSLGQEWEHSPAVQSFVDRLDELHTLAGTVRPAISFVHKCTGGSAALKEYRPDSTRYWWDYDGNASGPLNSSVCSDLNGMASSEKPTHVFWIQGEQDSGLYAGATEDQDAAFRERYARAATAVLKIIRGTIKSADRYSIPAYLQILGTRASGERRGMPIVRLAQYDAIAAPDINLNVGAVNPLDLPLEDDVHPTDGGYGILGGLWADAVFGSLT
ncbi:hypothetical protein B5M44_24120 [Shinella sumterensis]|uniref:hypothetical protein n=1 Tax=Shinella sumterensis TaxID=1967501 RepID=UPI00106ECDF5|nr:hypothetical protein [Shinella sumterensis]MCD1264558.1 hypothetical protein [Shinella sumterensis]TFE94109.1 hypothetical protein B5M44_24120 [Shinella sumterensis]